MPYYHVYFAYKYNKKEQRTGFLYNFQEEDIIRSIATPYMKNEAIHIGGKFVHPSDINEIDIFESEKPFQELFLLDGSSPSDIEDNTHIYRCFCDQKVRARIELRTHDFLTSPPKKIGLMESASFLGLNTNWSSATCALQLQEVAITLMAKRKNIKLDKATVEKILNKKIEGDLTFNDKYEAFSKQVETAFNIEMPVLVPVLRRMRTKVLHEGYNPKPEETEPIANFTIGLLKKLKDIS